jgi:transposase
MELELGMRSLPPAAKRSEPEASAAPRLAGAPRRRGYPTRSGSKQAKRRSFTAEYKARSLAEADACTEPGQTGELLRREGLYASHLTYWRKQRRDGALKELGQPRGRKPADRRDQEIAELQRRNERLESELAKARKVIEIQENASALLEQMLGTEGESGSTER